MSTTMVTGEGTNLIDHNHQISVMLEYYRLPTDDSDIMHRCTQVYFYYNYQIQILYTMDNGYYGYVYMSNNFILHTTYYILQC